MPKKVKQPHGGVLHVPDKGGPSPNPNGRPRKLVSKVIHEMHTNGCERVTPSQVSDVMEILLNATKEELTAMAQDEQHPIMIRLIARELLGKRGWDALGDVLDRAQGRPRRGPDIKEASGDATETRTTTIQLPGGLTLDL